MVVQPKLSTRKVNLSYEENLTKAGVHPLLARLWAARNVSSIEETQTSWNKLIAPKMLHDIENAAKIIANAIEQNKFIVIVADYDCDGATAAAVGMRALQQMGANVDFFVPNRFETGYGLSPEVINVILKDFKNKPDLIITVDNGIASIEGVESAKQHDIDVIITDHHLPADQEPEAAAIVNPNKNVCDFPSKNLAGVGVIFYVMMALRAELRSRNYFKDSEPRLDTLADLVALGTVADVVKLDANNRLLVTQGLNKIRSGKMQTGLRALFAVAGKDPLRASCFDLGFMLGPRINAAGRLEDMTIGINLLITDNESQALQLAQQLDKINQERRSIETTMREQAIANIESNQKHDGATICVYNADWHQGVVGIVASRLKDTYWRPTIAFAKSDDGELRGSGRSVPDVHLRDVLDLVSKRKPGIILKFGGHAMAAGLSLVESEYSNFVLAFEQAVIELTGKSNFEHIIHTDGSLESAYANAQVADLLDNQIWGSGFDAPVFQDEFQVINQRLLKDKHLKLRLQRDRQHFDAIWFNHNQPLPEKIIAAYRLDLNIWNGNANAQLILQHAQAAA